MKTGGGARMMPGGQAFLWSLRKEGPSIPLLAMQATVSKVPSFFPILFRHHLRQALSE
jgi:hypothetical protein